MPFLRPPTTHRDLLRLLVLLFVLQAVVQVATPAVRPPWRRTRGCENPGGLERGPAPSRPPLVAGSRDLLGQPAPAADTPPRRTRRGRRAPSARRRGSRGRRWTGHQSAGATTGLFIAHLNIQSLKPKLLELADELCKFKYDLISLNETWLKPATPTRLLVTPGYQLLRTDRPDGRGFGGTAVLVREGLNVTRVKVPTAYRRSPEEQAGVTLDTCETGR